MNNKQSNKKIVNNKKKTVNKKNINMNKKRTGVSNKKDTTIKKVTQTRVQKNNKINRKKYISLSENLSKVLIGLILILLLVNVTKLNNKNLLIKDGKDAKASKLSDEKKDSKKKEEMAEKIPIFTFHRIVSDELKNDRFKNDEWVASVKVFEEQIKYLYDNGYKTISMDQFYCWYEKKCEFPKKTVMLTFDDGNADDYFTVMPIIKKYNFKATTFIVGARTLDIDENPYDENVRTFITKELMTKTKNIYPNWEYQSHSFDLHVVESNGKEKVLNLTEDEIAEDFENNSVFGFKYMAYPFGVYNEKIIKVLEKYNYRLAFTFRVHEYATRESKRYEIPRIKINGFSNVEEIKKWLDY